MKTYTYHFGDRAAIEYTVMPGQAERINCKPEDAVPYEPPVVEVSEVMVNGAPACDAVYELIMDAVDDDALLANVEESE